MNKSLTTCYNCPIPHLVCGECMNPLQNLDEAAKLKMALQGLNDPIGIGCNQCFACVTGGSRPCLNLKKPAKTITRCQATTKNGKKCTRRPSRDGFCYQHC